MVIYMEKESVEALKEEDIKRILDENEFNLKYEEMEKYYRGDHPILHAVI